MMIEVEVRDFFPMSRVSHETVPFLVGGDDVHRGRCPRPERTGRNWRGVNLLGTFYGGADPPAGARPKPVAGAVCGGEGSPGQAARTLPSQRRREGGGGCREPGPVLCPGRCREGE